MLILDSHQTPEAEGCHRTLLSTPALDPCELPLQPDSPKRLTPHLDQVVHPGDHLAPEFHSLEHWELLVLLLLQLGLHLGKGGRERQVSSPVLDVTPELMPGHRTLSTPHLSFTAEQTHSAVDSDDKGQKNVLYIISLFFLKDIFTIKTMCISSHPVFPFT